MVNETSTLVPLDSGTEGIIVALVIFLSLMGVPMNLLVIYNLFKSWRNRSGTRIQSKSRALYFNIAFCDFLMCAVVMPWAVYYIEIGRPTPDSNQMAEDISYRLFCTTSGYVYNSLVRVMSITIFLMSIDRVHALFAPSTYSKRIYGKLFGGLIFATWIFATVSQALPFMAGIEYVEQPSRELVCGWSIPELLKLEQHQIEQNALTIFFPYLILVNIAFVFPTMLSVVLSVAVLCKLMRLKHIRPGSPPESHVTVNAKLMRASVTVFAVIATHVVLFGYLWFFCFNISLYLLGVPVTVYVERGNSILYAYLNSSYHIAIFLNSAIDPFIIYFRVFRGPTILGPGRRNQMALPPIHDLRHAGLTHKRDVVV